MILNYQNGDFTKSLRFGVPQVQKCNFWKNICVSLVAITQKLTVAKISILEPKIVRCSITRYKLLVKIGQSQRVLYFAKKWVFFFFLKKTVYRFLSNILYLLHFKGSIVSHKWYFNWKVMGGLRKVETEIGVIISL